MCNQDAELVQVAKPVHHSQLADSLHEFISPLIGVALLPSCVRIPPCQRVLCQTRLYLFVEQEL